MRREIESWQIRKVAFSGLLFCIVFALSISTVSSEAQEKTGEIIINSLVFEGLETLDEEFVASAIRLKPDLVLIEYEFSTIVRDDINRIYRLGAFERVEVYSEDLSPGRVDLIFILKERPTVRKVFYEGNKHIKKGKLKEIVELERGDRLSFSKISAGENEIKNHYFEKGYRFVKVDHRIDEVEEGIEVAFIVDEGPKSLVNKVVIEGNNNVSDWYFTHKVMKTQIDRFYNNKTLDEDLLEEDLALIEQAYAKLGYVRAKVVDHRVEFIDERSKINVHVTVDEGAKYKNGEITFTGNEKYEDETLYDLVVWRKGKVFNLDKEVASLDYVRTKYRNNGYLFSTIEGVENIDDARLTVDLDVQITEYEPATVRRIDIYGNEHTKDKVIRREVRLFPGDTYKENKLIRSIQRLSNLGYFDDVQPDIRVANRDTSEVDLILAVTEKTGITKFNFSAGYSSLDGLVGTLGLTWVNFDVSKLPFVWKCKGGGQELRFNTEFGKRRSQYNFGFTEPYLFDRRMAVGFDVYSTSNLRSYYRETTKGVSFFVGRPLSEYVSGRVSYSFEDVEVESTYDDANRLPSYVNNQLGKRYSSAVTFSVARDSRDNVFFASEGSNNSIAVKTAGGFLGGDSDFYKFTLTSSWFFHHIWKTALAVRAKAGYADTYSITEELPVFERYYLGGARTVRGYDEWEVGPKDIYENPQGGKAIFLTNFEYRIPVQVDFFHIISFWDAGYCWEELQDMNLQDMVSGVGAGIRINIPMMGMLGVDYGYGIADKRGQIHFNIGSTF